MNFLESFKMAIESIKSNALRSFLTMLGIIIGISSVIAILSLGEGGKNAISGEFGKIGANTVTIKVNNTKATNNDYFTLKDIDRIYEKVPGIKAISPLVQKSGRISSEKKGKSVVIKGTSPSIKSINNYDILYGRYFNEREFNESKNVAVIDSLGAKFLFGREDIVGESITVGGKAGAKKKLTIVGVYKMEGFIFGGENDTNMPVFIDVPVMFVKQMFTSDFYIDTLYVMGDENTNVNDISNASIRIIEAMKNNREKGIYKSESLLKQLDQINNVIGIFTGFIGAVAAISLIVGGIGVMNIMLVSVTERTREIGIRKAIGATTKNIMVQFLTEAVIISLIGGIIGLILGIGGAFLIGSIKNITPSLSLMQILLVIIFSSSVGIFFGIYPAKKAAKLDPIDALRYE